jgi:ketosteroid isomerase-like protein
MTLPQAGAAAGTSVMPRTRLLALRSREDGTGRDDAVRHAPCPTRRDRATIGGMDAIEYEHIRQLLGRYNLAIDLGDPEGWAATFTPDGTFRCTGLPEDSPLGGRYEGTDQLVAYAKLHYRIAKGRARHWNANLVIDGDGETARMRCYLLALTAGGGKLAGTTGIYDDRLRKVNETWLFVERHIAIDPGMP